MTKNKLKIYVYPLVYICKLECDFDFVTKVKLDQLIIIILNFDWLKINYCKYIQNINIFLK